jgi:major membrane immunogen (membrane-anchored lipoprotein)
MKPKIQKSNFNQLTKNVFLTGAVLFSASLLAQIGKKDEIDQKITPPSIVIQSFHREFPNKKAEWGMEKGDYEAEFKLNGSEAAAVYDKSGHRKELEIEIKHSEFPAAVLDYLKKNYPTDKITEATKMTNAKNAITYEAEITKKGKKQDVLFDASGKFIKIVNTGQE